MKLHLKSLALYIGILLSAQSYAQTPTPAVTAPAKPAVMAPASVPAAAPAAKPIAAAVPAGSDGKVWVNTGSKTYHCPGTKYYGKTKAGEYLSEADAKAKGNHPDHKKACS
jgi:hypothetical protein